MIVKLRPAVKSYLWGGTNLKSKWHKSSEEATISETWELSCNAEGLSVVEGGASDGKPLRDVVTAADLGKNCAEFPFFPVLNKLIDAAKILSVQVHPSDDYALSHEGQYGKTEMWHVLDAEEGAFIYLGLRCDLSAEEFSEAIERDTVCDFLNKVPVRAGDTYFIPAGTIHAIGAGITLYEVQQNSALTYRVYDFGRVDAQGNKRQLHVEKAKAVANLHKYDVPSPERGEMLGKCRYFSLYKFAGDREMCLQDSFFAVTATKGVLSVGPLTLRQGETAFVSAGERVLLSGGEYLLTCVEK